MVFVIGLFCAIPQVYAAGTIVRVAPASQTVNASSTFTITVDCIPQQPVKAFELKLSFNPSLVRVTSVTEGNFFAGFNTFFNAGEIDNSAGRIINVYDLIVGPGNVTVAGSLVKINFTAKTTTGTSSLSLYEVRLTNESDYITIEVTSGSVKVSGGSSPPPNPPPSPPPDNPPSEENTPPNTPVKPIGPTLIEAGAVYSYDSSAVDPDGDSVRLRFDWGDGTMSAWSALVASNTSVTMSHAWTNVSNYPVRVMAQDAEGLNSSWSETLTVMISQVESEGYPPVGSFQLPANASVNHSIVFDASGCYDPDGMILSYLWDFGDGVTGNGSLLIHTYASPGQYNVTLTVTDNAGMTSTVSRLVTIAESPGTPTGQGISLLKPNELLMVLGIAMITSLVLLFVYRFRTRGITLQKQIEASKHRLALMDHETADIDQIVDALFAEYQKRKQTPRTDTLLDAYNDLIVGRVERNPAIAIPRLNIDQVEQLVDRRVHTMIAEKLDKM